MQGHVDVYFVTSFIIWISCGVSIIKKKVINKDPVSTFLFAFMNISVIQSHRN